MPATWSWVVGLADPGRRVDSERYQIERATHGAGGKDAGIAQLILVNGPPASGKSTLARRYVDDHDSAALVEFDVVRMTLPNWEDMRRRLAL